MHGVAAETLRRALRGETWAYLPDAAAPAMTAEEQDAAIAESAARMQREMELVQAKKDGVKDMLGEIAAAPDPQAADIPEEIAERVKSLGFVPRKPT